MYSLWLLPVALASGVLALPSPLMDDGLQYNSPEARQKNLPMIELPYGSYQATQYIAKADVILH